MQRIARGRFGDRDHRFDIEIGARPLPGNFARLVGRADMQRQRVVRRMNRNGGNTCFAGGPGDANGNLAAIGYQ